MGKGALPVPYIVAIVIAIIVIIVLLYWFYTSYVSTDVEAKRKFCEAQRTTYCVAWKASNYGETAGKRTVPPGEWETFAGDCVENNVITSVSADDCRRMIG